MTRDSRQVHIAEQPASRDKLEWISPLMHSSQTAWQLFNLRQSIEIRIPHLLGHVGQLHTNVFHTFDSVSLCCKQVNNKALAWAIASRMRTHSQTWHRLFTVSFTLCLKELRAEPSGSERDRVTVWTLKHATPPDGSTNTCWHRQTSAPPVDSSWTAEHVETSEESQISETLLNYFASFISKMIKCMGYTTHI